MVAPDRRSAALKRGFALLALVALLGGARLAIAAPAPLARSTSATSATSG